ncbi:MAG TPA: Xaa-Pro peptidase family protein [Syntrophorhabdaceae bacterium]|nr:Xaa-Pro peptidase family protein [Syntrophorhabdaceae bacterium]HQH42458.1 Xaa-Pro peptidase family protein [Syntrophorhabdaceae bacterium]HQK45769.1 Xaa-Pro peptidase family protein [Syntrophorhabdaceae bacterium]HRR71137.1 Xaa-Pro peptidase family protein [Syntrophorhabdaceae bacterium]HRV22233.1 Xaa-Pro peptidase family protein [Syntrophorhabdaceae bacterium]
MLRNLSVGELTPKEELEKRIINLKKKMEARGIDLSLIIQNVDLFYFAGTVQKGALIVPVDGEPMLFVERNADRVRYETPFDFIPIKRERDIRDILNERGIKGTTLGMEFDVVPVALFERWRDILKIGNVVDISNEIKDLRLIKSPFEIEQIKKSGEVTSFVLGRAKDVIREGMTELEIDAILGAEGRKKGHQGFLRMRGLNQEMMNIYITHERSCTIPSSGDVPIAGVGITHAIAQGASMNVIRRGIPILLDYGGGYNGYITDETRAYVIGNIDEFFRKPYDIAREIVETTMDFAKEGINGKEVYERAHSIVKKADLDDHFMGHGKGKVGFIGHGLGLEINELPVITPRHSIILQEGMVFAFEPKFIFPGRGAIGIEVDFIVRKDCLERVTDAPIDLVFI